MAHSVSDQPDAPAFRRGVARTRFLADGGKADANAVLRQILDSWLAKSEAK